MSTNEKGTPQSRTSYGVFSCPDASSLRFPILTIYTDSFNYYSKTVTVPKGVEDALFFLPQSAGSPPPIGFPLRGIRAA